MTNRVAPERDDERGSQQRGILAFLIVTLGLAWLPLTHLRSFVGTPHESVASLMLHGSVVYVTTMTLPPLVALFVVRRWIDRSPLDYGAGRPSKAYRILAVVGPFAVMAVASGIATLLEPEARLSPHRHAERDWLLPLLYIAVIAFLWIQSAAEEIGWRGYLMPRMMNLLGAWPGLFAHGALWGLWYAPLFAAASGADDRSIRSLQFVLTSILLGILLGWLRIASRSIVTSATANAVLTLAAGLPLVALGTTLTRSAIYDTTGWIPLSIAILVVFASGRHAAVHAFTRRR